MKPKKILEFKTKKGRIVEFFEPNKSDLKGILRFVNEMIAEDTYLNLQPYPYTIKHEAKWLKDLISKISRKVSLSYFVKHDGRIIGSCDLHKWESKMKHNSTFGIMISKNFRGEGIGEKMILTLLSDAKKIGVKTVTLDLFSNNKIAQNLYQKVGFKKYYCLPKAVFHKGKYLDDIGMYKIL